MKTAIGKTDESDCLIPTYAERKQLIYQDDGLADRFARRHENCLKIGTSSCEGWLKYIDKEVIFEVKLNLLEKYHYDIPFALYHVKLFTAASFIERLAKVIRRSTICKDEEDRLIGEIEMNYLRIKVATLGKFLKALKLKAFSTRRDPSSPIRSAVRSFVHDKYVEFVKPLYEEAKQIGLMPANPFYLGFVLEFSTSTYDLFYDPKEAKNQGVYPLEQTENQGVYPLEEAENQGVYPLEETENQEGNPIEEAKRIAREAFDVAHNQLGELEESARKESEDIMRRLSAKITTWTPEDSDFV